MADMSMTDFVHLGTRYDQGATVPFALSTSDRRNHLYVIGKTGTGKSTLTRNLILQDIYAGKGVGVIDPHGGLAADILEHVPASRIGDVVYFDPSDFDHPIGFNLVAQVRPDRRHLVASGIVDAFKGIWSESWGPRLEYILYASVAALLDCENVSLLGVQRMLTDEQYRAWITKQIKDPGVRSFWEDEFANYDRRFLNEAIAPIQNKVGQLLMSPALRNILGQVRSRIDARFMMDNRRIFVANLSKGKIGADKANLLGSLWVTQFQLAAMSRADVPEEEREDFFLYVDEFHSFVSDSFATILSEARKYRLCLTITHQYVAQLKPAISAAIIGNVGSLVSFRVGHHDAQALEQAFGETYPARQFTALSNYEICAKALSGGSDMEPFLGKTHAPFGERIGKGDKIIRNSRMRFSTPRATVERRIAGWMRRGRPRPTD